MSTLNYFVGNHLQAFAAFRSDILKLESSMLDNQIPFQPLFANRTSFAIVKCFEWKGDDEKASA